MDEGQLVRTKGINGVSYSAVSAAKFVAAAGTAPFFSLYGSAAKGAVLEILKVTVSGAVATAAVYGDLILSKRTVAISGGTSTTIVPTPLNTSSPASGATKVKSYTTAPTPGTGGGVVAGALVFVPLLGTVVNNNGPWQFEFGLHDEQQPLQLRGTGEGIELSWATTLGNASTLMVSVDYREYTEV